MRTTLNIDEDLLKKVAIAVGIDEKTKLIHLGLESLLRAEAYKRLAGMHGIYKKAKAPPRRRPK